MCGMRGKAASLRVILCPVLKQLEKAGVAIKAKKYDFGTSAYLGHIMRNGVVKPDKDKTSLTQAVQHQKPKQMLKLSLVSQGTD